MGLSHHGASHAGSKGSLLLRDGYLQPLHSAGLMPSFGSVGDALDDAMMESFWSSMRNELLDRKRLTPRIELSNAMFDYIAVFYNRRRRHSKLGYVSPIEYEGALDHEAV